MLISADTHKEFPQALKSFPLISGPFDAHVVVSLFNLKRKSTDLLIHQID